jgi:BirA family biotin operon repressor/biotin-[acetyl-CoA-carboxylase] ligase
MSLLDADQIRQPISRRSRERLDDLEVFAEIESTNSYLMSQPPPAPGRFRVALAEHQTAGRGQRESRWLSPASSGLCLSMAYTFAHPRADLSAVTLAAGVGVARALEEAGVADIRLKWPNDLILRGGKLGGILTEVRQSPSTAATVVIGVGINIDLGDSRNVELMSPSVGTVSDLASFGIEIASRSALSARLVQHLFDTLSEFEEGGFPPFAADYERLDWLHGREIRVSSGGEIFTGVAAGVEADGSLIVDTDCGSRRVISGSVQLASGGTTS